ncbi:G2/mitotic-specific cyclin S13-7 isoform X2 [Beta vulgaris subsp. vulgaris]|uniref:G2/mitotic-specific cyclin S13-7 isoform X2 n=1 Tax=Beta vulgaris subsp. vulgaris TaxID=3555 RepID=UPI002036C656|nr:G2/mitotic-specific cyclin S13-7 isoform X2 [Beta vulgaris subsp. vulgaris]
MASRVVIPQLHHRVEGKGGIKQKDVAEGKGRNRKALNDIGNLVTIPDVEGKVQRPITRSFGAKLLANAQEKAAQGVARKAVAVAKPQVKKPVLTKPKPVEVIEEVKQERQEKVVSQNEKSGASKKNKKKAPTMTALLTARSKAACGLSNKPKEAVVDIDASDVNNELAVVEYVEDIYMFYKLAENECRPRDYMNSQPEINEKMRAILVDWLIEVHKRFDLMPETLYLTINLVDRFLSLQAVPRRELQLVGLGAMLIACKYEEIWAPEVNDFVAISDKAYSNDQVLKMEKAILGKLEWYITVPTPCVFLSRYIKASGHDNEMENLVNFLAELALMHYGCISFCPSMVAASAVYVARHTLFKTPVWTETLESHTGFSESQLIECAKMLVNLQSVAPGHKLQTVYKKYSKPEKCAVALCSPPKSLLAST